MTLATDKQPPFTPAPFLGPLFKSGDEPVIEAGYLYSADETFMHGISQHRAIDFGLPRGAEILVPADGWAVCTYGEVKLTHDGQPRVISMEQAIKHTDLQLLRPPVDLSEPWIGYYGSYIVQIWHGNGRYTQYAHVDCVDERVPFYPPMANDKGDLLHHPVLRWPVKEYKQGQAFKVRQGEVLATVGMTGCGWGKRCYETAEFGAMGRPDFRQSEYTYWDQPHLHFMVFGKRAGKNRAASMAWDPFGIYGERSDGYPKYQDEWANKGSLWMI
jgi:hypothetical protein